jgi:hypothetical protein
MIQKAVDNGRLRKRYISLLHELVKLRLSKFPEELLPAPKETISQTLTEIMMENPEEVEGLKYAITRLDSFESKSGAGSDFIAKLITVPILITLIYTIWLGFRSESWLWTIFIVLIPLTVGGIFIWRIIGKPKNSLILLVYLLLETIALGSVSVVAIKLAFHSGFWGIIQLFSNFSWSGLCFALIAIFLGYFMCSYVNKIFFFLR